MVLKYIILFAVKNIKIHSFDMKISNHLFLTYGQYNHPMITFHFRHSLAVLQK
jgi:hypothetical protein